MSDFSALTKGVAKSTPFVIPTIDKELVVMKIIQCLTHTSIAPHALQRTLKNPAQYQTNKRNNGCGYFSIQ